MSDVIRSCQHGAPRTEKSEAGTGRSSGFGMRCREIRLLRIPKFIGELEVARLATMAEITDYEQAMIENANAQGKTPVVFVHGLWLLPTSWDRWRAVFEKAGYSTLIPGWPDDPNTVEDANRHPEVMANKTVGQVADHFEDIVRQLKKKPAVIGHSFGGLLTQILAGRG